MTLSSWRPLVHIQDVLRPAEVKRLSTSALLVQNKIEASLVHTKTNLLLVVLREKTREELLGSRINDSLANC